MTKKSLAEPVFAETVTHIPASIPKAALRRCCAAYDRAYKAKFEECKDDGEADFLARTVGQRAFLDAMPMLVGLNGIRGFVAVSVDYDELSAEDRALDAVPLQGIVEVMDHFGYVLVAEKASQARDPQAAG